MANKPGHPGRAQLAVALGSIAVLALVAVGFPSQALPAVPQHRPLDRWVRELFQQRAGTLITKDPSCLRAAYGNGSLAREALAHEAARAANLHCWLALHRARLLTVHPNVRLIHLERTGQDRVTAYVTLTTILTYDYPGRNHVRPNMFGYTTYHAVVLERAGDRWVVSSEWYEDPLRAHMPNGESYPPGLAIGPLPKASKIPTLREAAARYADCYSGVALPPRATGRYNRNYLDFTFLGGDCANFASQVLSDRDAGRAARDWVWCCDARGATIAWSRADALLSYLLGSGRARMLSEGTLSQVTTSNALALLRPGDLVGYFESGRVRHVSVVAAQDSLGWPLVDSHSADRYHMPFDLGWGNHVRFWLVQTELPQ